jgi:hypothetical protein
MAVMRTRKPRGLRSSVGSTIQASRACLTSAASVGTSRAPRGSSASVSPMSCTASDTS